MSVSRKSPGEYSDDEMTTLDYLADKKVCQDRTGYPSLTDKEIEQQAVDEKLPMGSQSY